LKKNVTTRELIKQSRKLAFPKKSLCLIIFDNGEGTFIPLIQGEFKAISASLIKKH